MKEISLLRINQPPSYMVGTKNAPGLKRFLFSGKEKEEV